jgi:hypothetical protein
MSRRLFVALASAALLVAPALSSAQETHTSFGIGPRLSLVRGDLPSGTPSTRLFGGTMRLRSSPHVALELAMDYRAETSLDNTSRLRQTPIQASLLLFPVRSTFSPYLLGGLGLYTEMHDTLGPAGSVLATTSDKKSGWHLGFGAELLVARHSALFADYRFRFVKFGASSDPTDEPINLPGLQNLGITHHGSMWTAGMAFYF